MTQRRQAWLVLALAVTGALAACGSDEDADTGPDPMSVTEFSPAWAEHACGETVYQSVTGATESDLWRLDGSPPVEVTVSGDGDSPTPSDEAELKSTCLHGPDGEVILAYRTETVDGERHSWFAVLDGDGEQVWSRHVVGTLHRTEPELRVDRDGHAPQSFRLTDGEPGTPPVPSGRAGFVLDHGAVLAPAKDGTTVLKTPEGTSTPVPSVKDLAETGVSGASTGDGMVLINGTHLTRLDTAQGRLAWSVEIESRQEMDPDHVLHDAGNIEVGDDVVVISGAGTEPTAYDLETGEMLWELDPAAIEGVDASELDLDVREIAGGRVLIHADDGSYRAPVVAIVLDARTGEQQPTYGAPVSALTEKGMVVVGSVEGENPHGDSVRTLATDADELRAAADAYRAWSEKQEEHS